MLPLRGVRVVELAGLAPAPFASLMLLQYGADVIRILRPGDIGSSIPWHGIHSEIALDLKTSPSLQVLIDLLRKADILIEPHRPGVLEALGLSPEFLLKNVNPRLIIARLTGFRRDGKYSNMAGHDINYLAVSGVLSQLGRKDQLPYAPANILADFAGGGLMCAFGILAALLNRSTSRKGQVVESNMVDGSAFLATFMRLMRATPLWDQPRGENVLDGGCPYYDVYECKDGGFMAVGALEPQFFRQLVKNLGLDDQWLNQRHDRTLWPKLRDLIRLRFLEKTRAEWEVIFDGKDACATPVLSQEELESSGYEQRPPFALIDDPGVAQSSSSCHEVSSTETSGMKILNKWLGWRENIHYKVKEGRLEKLSASKL